MKGDRQIGRRKPGQSHMSELGSAEVNRSLSLLVPGRIIYLSTFAFFAGGRWLGWAGPGGWRRLAQDEEGGVSGDASLGRKGEEECEWRVSKDGGRLFQVALSSWKGSGCGKVGVH